MAGIDRDYWLDYAKDAVSKSIDSREKAADRLDTFLLWIWGIYTTIFVLGSILDFLSANIWQLVVCAQPILVIMIARYTCIMVSMPTSVSADPAVVAEIIDGHTTMVLERKRKLNRAILLTLVSIVSLFVALVGYNALDPQKLLKQELYAQKLRKAVHNETIAPASPSKEMLDSLVLQNQISEQQVKQVIKAKKHELLSRRKTVRLDTLILLDK